MLFESTGTLSAEMRTVAYYDEIILHDKINLILRYDTVETIKVEAGKNLLPGIETVVTDGKLIIRDENKFQWSRDFDQEITIVISGRSLNKITYFGAGNISSGNLWKADKFEIDSWTGIGSFKLDMEVSYMRLMIRTANADIQLTGSAKLTSVYCADYGSINLANFVSDDVIIDYRSIRKSTINVKNKLDVNIHYKGDIYYIGNPEINLFRNNSGLLIKAG